MHHTKKFRRRRGQQYSPTGRRQRHDVQKTRLLERDELALTWIGQQYAMRLEQIQELLGQLVGYGAAHDNAISVSATLNVIARWKQAGWVIARRIDAKELLWVWLTKKGLTQLELPYQYQSLDALSKHDRDHLYAITQVRLELDTGEEDIEWTSERTLLQGTHRRRGHKRVHRPDAVLARGTDLIAIEVELSHKTESLLSDILVTLLCERDYHGHAYHALKAEVGEEKAKEQSPLAWRQYTEVYYFARPAIRRYIRRVLAKQVQQGKLFSNEAAHLFVWWYPLAVTDAELAQEGDEEDAPADLKEDEWMFLDEGAERDG